MLPHGRPVLIGELCAHKASSSITVETAETNRATRTAPCLEPWALICGVNLTINTFPLMQVFNPQSKAYGKSSDRHIFMKNSTLTWEEH